MLAFGTITNDGHRSPHDPEEIKRSLWIFPLLFNHKIDCSGYNFPMATQIIIHFNRLRIACETISWNANLQGPQGSVVFLYKYIYLSVWPPPVSTGAFFRREHTFLSLWSLLGCCDHRDTTTTLHGIKIILYYCTTPSIGLFSAPGRGSSMLLTASAPSFAKRKYAIICFIYYP